MDLEQQLHADLVTGTDLLNAVDHRVDVPQHLACRDVRRCVIESANGLGAQQSPCPDVEALDSRRGNCLGAQQDAGKRLGVDKRRRLDVQSSDRCLGLRNIGSDVTVESKAALGEKIWDVGLVVA